MIGVLITEDFGSSIRFVSVFFRFLFFSPPEELITNFYQNLKTHTCPSLRNWEQTFLFSVEDLPLHLLTRSRHTVSNKVNQI